MYKKEGGFTILETMIVLTVSSVMLITAIGLFSGEQRKTQFAQGIRTVESMIQDVINDTETGYFPNIGNTTCVANAASGPTVSTGGSSEQGSNIDCVFLGKAMHLQQDKMAVYPVVGNKDISTADDTLASARPRAAAVMLEEQAYQWGLNLRYIYWDNSGVSHHTDGALITIASSPNGTGFSTPGTLNSGRQRISTYSSGLGPGFVPVSYNSGESIATIDGSLQGITNASWPSGGVVVLCFDDAPPGNIGRRKGGVIVAGGPQGISTRLQIDGDGFQCV